MNQPSTTTTTTDRRYRRFLEGQEREDRGHYLEAAIAYEGAGALHSAAQMRERVAAQVLARPCHPDIATR